MMVNSVKVFLGIFKNSGSGVFPTQEIINNPGKLVANHEKRSLCQLLKRCYSPEIYAIIPSARQFGKK